MADVLVLNGVEAMSSRSSIGRRVTELRVASVDDVHAVGDIDPEELANMFLLLAFERTQAASQS